MFVLAVFINVAENIDNYLCETHKILCMYTYMKDVAIIFKMYIKMYDLVENMTYL